MLVGPGRDGSHHAALSQDHRNRLEQDDGLVGIGVTPAFAIDQRALIVPSDAGNVMWESVSLVTDEVVATIRGLGGVRAIALSHPHFYSSMVRWSEALGGIPIYVHSADREWVRRSSAQVKLWNGGEPGAHLRHYTDSLSRTFSG